MADWIVFNFAIPLADNFTKISHQIEKFNDWEIKTAKLFGGLSKIGDSLMGLWCDDDLNSEENLIEDYNHWYKVAIRPEDIEKLKKYLAKTALIFGQKYIYLERAGIAEYINALSNESGT